MVKTSKDLMLRFLDLLGAKWRRQEKEMPIQDWACNEWFDLVSDIDVVLMFMPKNHPERKNWELARKVALIKGTAYWIGTRDVLTNLAIKTGGAYKEVDY